MLEIDKYNKGRREIETPFDGLPHAQTKIIYALITMADPITGIVNDISYQQLAEILRVKPSPGRKDSGVPTKQTIRNYIKSVERECGEYFKVISEGRILRFLFPELPKIFSKVFENREVNIHDNRVNTPKNIDENDVFKNEVDIGFNTELNTPTNAVKNNNIFNITNTNKQTPTADSDFSFSKKPISDDFYPNTKTIELALSKGLIKVTELSEIQAFIKHNKKQNSQWADFNPVFITWLERDAQYMQKQQQKTQGQLRSQHNERGTNQGTLNPTALEQVSQQHGISIESLWGDTSCELNSCDFIEGTLVQPLDEADCNLRTAFY